MNAETVSAVRQGLMAGAAVRVDGAAGEFFCKHTTSEGGAYNAAGAVSVKYGFP